MAYFKKNETDNDPLQYWPPEDLPVFGAVDSALQDDGYDVQPIDFDLTPAEKRERARERWKMIYGIRDFLLTLLGMIIILILAAVIISLYEWVRNDIASSLLLMTKAF